MREKMMKDTILGLELTNFCNCSCIMCTQSSMNVNKGFMSESVFEKILRNIVDNDMCFSKLVPFGLGESTLHPQFHDFMKKIFSLNSTGRYFKAIDLHTNAINLDEKTIDLFIQYGEQLNTISFSIDAIHPETYQKIRRNPNFEDMIKNITCFYRKRGKKRLPRTNLQFIVMDENAHESRDFLDYWSRLFRKNGIEYQVNHDWEPPMRLDTIFFKRLNPIDHSNLEQSEKLHRDVVSDLGIMNSTDDSEKRAVNSTEYRGERRRYPCSGPFKYTMISWDGEVTVCCIDTLRELSLGNIKDKDLYDIWMSDRNHSYRLAHISGDLSCMPKCRNCNNLDSPHISRDELRNYIKKYGPSDYMRYLEDI
ncbi:MAG: radical SAM/SPASM domain-containing protein [Candidatus Muiribacteriaceae bacterium]